MNRLIHGVKLAKDPLSILSCASVTGEKLQPLRIGKSKQPRCFANKSFKFNRDEKFKIIRKCFMFADQYPLRVKLGSKSLVPSKD